MFLPWTVLLVLLLPHQTDTKKKRETNPADLFNFRYNQLRRFNYARRIIASGDLAQLFETIKLVGVKLPTVGPASDMYRLEWSRPLEQKAFENGKLRTDENGPKNGAEYDGEFVYFYWMGDIVEALVETVSDFIPAFREIVKKFQELIEFIVIVIWMAMDYPWSFPYDKDKHDKHGATEILMGSRYEIGCYSLILYSVCALNASEYTGRLFTRSASCVHCPPGSECEWFREEDGSYREGNLCIINRTATAMIAEAKAEAERAKLSTADPINDTTTVMNSAVRPELLAGIIVFLIVYFRFFRFK